MQSDIRPTEAGNLPLSLRRNSASYTGKLIATSSAHRTACTNIAPKLIAPLCSKTLATPSIMHARLSSATVATITNIAEKDPNSIIPFLYLSRACESVTFAVRANPDSVMPSILRIVSMAAKRYEVILLKSHILCAFHHSTAVSPHCSDSTKLQEYAATTTYANGTNQGLVI